MASVFLTVLVWSLRQTLSSISSVGPLLSAGLPVATGQDPAEIHVPHRTLDPPFYGEYYWIWVASKISNYKHRCLMNHEVIHLTMHHYLMKTDNEPFFCEIHVEYIIMATRGDKKIQSLNK